ncbi:DHH family phosphoesterase [Natrinema hispanicum]|uniref:Oligoribonuclease NrnB or cAMP/cGMP phosphodiesterase, DHH superfamily n=1 Tax=Natrinema hispanicum TaxID=392421 RepID=A0A1G6HY84_9EURY|nr:phosphohydrolase [Natrinema hispanicum]SDB99140.1 Oligoribonuclease NrnB or cAMP/cGMP phosphodiesterase, DHH superfamily [Natrinema hispanicum]SES91063.1 Oligoribonuclease NrnB or cAMP/cGMP phosphodiesterase, DHH superfamily [Natrinema hispanicum]
MYDELIESGDLPLARKSVLPGTGFFLPDTLEEDLEAQQTEAALEGAEVAVIADPDADGLACVALLREAYDDIQNVPEPDDGEADADDDEADEPLEEPEPTPHTVALIPASPHDVEDALARVAEYGDDGIDLFVCDLAPDRYEYVEEELNAALETADSVAWYDHHQWGDDVAQSVRDAGVDLVVGDSDEECSADVVYRSLEYDFEPVYEELAAVTRDHDLWLREDPRSDDLADYAYWTDPAEYVEVVREYGVDLPAWVEEYIAERRVEKEALIEQAVGRAELREIGGYTVGITYGRCSQNEVAEAMREQGADASVIVKPAGSASIRGTDEFDRCHEVAGKVNGGGHPKAAGCKPDIYDDMLDYANHWTTRGAVTKQVILDAFRQVVTEADAAEDTDEDA